MRNYEKPSLQTVVLTTDVICTSLDPLKLDANGLTYGSNANITFA